MDKYIKAAFNELLNEDGLAVMAKGLGIQRLLIKFLQYYSMAQPTGGRFGTFFLDIVFLEHSIKYVHH